MAFYLDGRRLVEGKPFVDAAGNQYSKNFLTKATPEQLAAVGVEKVVDNSPVVKVNTKFYYGPGSPRPVEEVQARLCAEDSRAVSSHLSQTDWYLTRRLDTGEEVPAAVTEHRAACRTVHDLNESAIIACTSIEELEALVLEEYPSLTL